MSRPVNSLGLHIVAFVKIPSAYYFFMVFNPFEFILIKTDFMQEKSKSLIAVRSVSLVNSSSTSSDPLFLVNLRIS